MNCPYDLNIICYANYKNGCSQSYKKLRYEREFNIISF